VKTKTKTCHCASHRRCDPCAERDLDLLIAKCKSDPKYQAEEALRDTIIIDPRPEAREGRGGFHRSTQAAPVAAPVDDEKDDGKYISARVAAYREPDGKALTWCCAACGPLGQREMPLLDEQGIGHCPRVGCDATMKLAAK
jgi:hypothetical protein